MAQDDTLKVLKKPVHAVILRPHHLQELQKRGKLPGSVVTRPIPDTPLLPTEEKSIRERYNPLAGFDRGAVLQPTRDAIRKTKLTVLHDNVPPLPDQLKPPCDTCQTSACCRAFVVAITEDEYNSGYYEPYAVKLDPKYMKQIQGRILLPSTATSPVHKVKEKTEYYLEGRIGEPCPFLKDNRCSIYEHRPITCRVYTCVGDARITQGMRDGTESIFGELE